MNMYIWEYLDKGLTNNYHSGGGLLIVAETLEIARTMAPKDCGVENTDPDIICSVSLTERQMIIFPDAGCC